MIKINHKTAIDNLKKITVILLSLLIIFFTSKIMLKGAGCYDSRFSAVLLAILIIFLSSSKKCFFYIVIPIGIVYSLYTPIGLIFGPPDYKYIASVFATDLLESKEFLFLIPIKNYLYGIIIIPLLFSYYAITKKFGIDFTKNKTFICLAIVTAVFNQAPTLFFKDIITSSQAVTTELARLSDVTIKSQWGKSSITNKTKYDDYVLIIGESVRRDYMHSYGYPIQNTPFIEKANSTIVDGLTSGGANTVASLRLMLTKPNKEKWQPNYGLNLIDLIKSAGIKTYWLSNQGFIGTYDTPITYIAKRSDYKKFLKISGDNSENTSDLDLVSEFKNVIDKNTKNKRFIVIHLYGSHPNACDRINDYPKILKNINKEYDYLNCYISSIKKTDMLLSEIYQTLNQEKSETGRSFSMIYFADHGLAHREIDGKIIFNNNKESKRHHNIPLFRIDSDSEHHSVIKSFKSGLNFTESIGNWLGINNPLLGKQYDLFNGVNDTNDYGLQQQINELNQPDDPAIDIRNHH